jgi:hypothetical protein
LVAIDYRRCGTFIDRHDISAPGVMTEDQIAVIWSPPSQHQNRR